MPHLDHPLISERYFFPRASRLEEPFWVQGAAGRLACCYHRPHAQPRATLVHFHGNGEVAGDWLDLAQALALGAGVNVLLAEYRGYGQSEGTPALAGMLADVVPLLEASGSPPAQTVVFGRSVGSIYALEAVHQQPALGGLILESGIADPLQRVLLRVEPEELGATPEELEAEARSTLDHQAKLAGYPGRVLVLHAEHDHLVDVSHARRNHAWALAAAERELVVFPQGDHNSILAANAERYLAKVIAFLRAW